MIVRPVVRWTFLGIVIVPCLGLLTWGAAANWPRPKRPHVVRASPTESPAPDPTEDMQDEEIKLVVKAIHPRKGELQRLSTQPGSVQAFESVKLFAKVPGFLKKQTVDIGDTVKKGQVLAVVDVPELEAALKRSKAGLQQAESKVEQMEARVTSAAAELDAANAGVTRSIATENAAAAWVRYRHLQLKRMEELVRLKAVEQKLEDEAREYYDAAVEKDNEAKEAITAKKARVLACKAKIVETNADVKAAKSEVKVAEAEVEKAKVLVDFATITAPFDGVITARNMFENDFVRAANEGSNIEPLLTVHRTDLFRVVVLIPDRDVPFTDVGDSAEMEIDSLPGKRFQGKVSRFAKSLDPQTRLMRVEIDLPNPTGELLQGMYGQVTIVLDRERDLLSIPSSCLVAQSGESKSSAATMSNLRWDIPIKAGQKKGGEEAAVFVIREGHLKLVPFRLGANNGLRAAVLSGLSADDEVVLNPLPTYTDGAEATLTEWDEMTGKAVASK